MTLTNDCGSTEDMVEVSGMSPPAPLSLGNDTTLCPNEEIVLSFDPGLGDFIWQDGSTNSTLTVSAPGIYALTVSNLCGASNDSITVDYYPEPQVFFDEGVIELCDGETVEFHFDPDIGDYIWNDGEPGPDYVVSTPGVYTVTVSNVCGSDFASVEVLYDYEPEVDLGPDITLCPQQLPYTINLDGLPDVEEWLWEDGTTDPDFTIYDAGTYGVTVSNSCFEATDEIVVFLEDDPPIVELPEDTVVCTGSVLFLDVSNVPGTYLWQDGSQGAVYGVAQSGTYSVTVTNVCGEDSDEVFVDFSDGLPPLDLGSDVSLCPGETINLYAGVSGVEYLWQDGSTADSIVVSAGGTVILTISNDCGTLSDSLIVTEDNAAPDAGLPDTLGVCQGQSVSISTIVGNAMYTWNTGSTASVIQAIDPGLYILTVTNTCGTDVDSTVVTDLGDIPVVNLGPDQSICPGDTLILDPGISGIYLWQNGSMSTTYAAVDSGEVVLSITNTCGSANDTVEISLLDPVPPLDLGSDTSICPGSSIIFSPGIPDVSYLWSDGSMGTFLTNTAGGIVYLDISNTCGLASDTVVVTLLPDLPTLDLGLDFSICPGDTAILDPGISDVEYLWQDGSTGNTLVVNANTEIILTVSNSCGSATDTLLVTEDNTAPTVDLGPDVSVCEGESVLVDPGIPGVSYLWQDGSTGSTFLATTTETVILEVSNSCGTARDTVSIVVDGAAPEVDLGPDTVLCDGAILTLMVDNTLI